jgi:hypothetical protein
MVSELRDKARGEIHRDFRTAPTKAEFQEIGTPHEAQVELDEWPGMR